MATYSIKELEQISGIKAHTIRIWEQRHKILKPQRTPTNIRFYTDCDLKLILRISLLNKQGHRISKIAEMSEKDLEDQCSCMEHSVMKEEWQMAELTASMIELDEARFEEVLTCAIRKDGFEQAMLETILPFLERIGVMWLSGSVSPAQEHFISNLIRQKIIAEIDRIPFQPSKMRSLLFLPEGELHELGLLFAYYLLKVRGRTVTYLGANVPLGDVLEVAKTKRITEVYTLMTSKPGEKKMEEFMSQLCAGLGKTSLYVSGYQTQFLNLSEYPNAILYKSMPHLTELIGNVKKL